MTENHSFYDDFREANFGLLEHHGTLDVFSPSNADGDENDESMAPSDTQNELAFCHLTAMWRYSTLSEVPATRVLTPRSLGPGFYGDSSSVLMAMHQEGMVSFATPATLVHLSSEDGWQNYKERLFIFNNNSTEPPPVLPLLTENKNYIGTGLRAFGIAVSLIAILGSFVAMVWTLRSSKTRVVRASQPIFLILICVGTLLMGASIIPLSIDDEIASTYGCSVSCQLVPWLYTVGFALVFAALYSKTKRVTLLLQKRQVKRIKVSARDVILPLISLLAANILVLVLWTTISPMQFRRTYKSGKDNYGRYLESYGGCFVGSEGEYIPYGVTLTILNAGVLLFANIQAYRAREIHTEFSESRYIGITMVSMLQAWAIGIPLMFLVNDNPQALFLVLTSVIFVGCMAILGLIMLPKFLQRKKKGKLWRRSSFQSGLECTTPDIEKQRKSVHISGLDNISERMLRGEMKMDSDRSIGDDSVDSNGSDSSSASDATGIRVYANEAAQKNVLLEVNLENAKRENEDMLEEMRNLLKETEEEGGVLKIPRKDLQEIYQKFSPGVEPKKSRLSFQDDLYHSD